MKETTLYAVFWAACAVVLISAIWAVALTGAPYAELSSKQFIECVKVHKPTECGLSVYGLR